jgi:hypothetical protein
MIRKVSEGDRPSMRIFARDFTITVQFVLTFLPTLACSGGGSL